MSTTRAYRTQPVATELGGSPSSPGPTFLQIQGGSNPTMRMIELPDSGPVRIGRGARCEVQLDGPGLGEVQCMLRRRGETWHYQPVGPAGQVWIDERGSDQQRPLTSGVPFRVGEHWLVLRPLDSATNDWGTFDAPISVDPGPTPAPIEAEPPAEPARPQPPAPAPDENAERLRRWEARLEQRERWLKDRQDERRWEARWKSAGETIRARSTPPASRPTPASRVAPPTSKPTPAPAPSASTPPPRPPSKPVDRPAQTPPVSRIIEPRRAEPIHRVADAIPRPPSPRVVVRPLDESNPTTRRPAPAEHPRVAVRPAEPQPPAALPPEQSRALVLLAPTSDEPALAEPSRSDGPTTPFAWPVEIKRDVPDGAKPAPNPDPRGAADGVLIPEADSDPLTLKPDEGTGESVVPTPPTPGPARRGRGDRGRTTTAGDQARGVRTLWGRAAAQAGESKPSGQPAIPEVEVEVIPVAGPMNLPEAGASASTDLPAEPVASAEEPGPSHAVAISPLLESSDWSETVGLVEVSPTRLRERSPRTDAPFPAEPPVGLAGEAEAAGLAWPSARAIFEAQGRRSTPAQDSTGRARPRSREPEPTDALTPRSWAMPAWLAAPPVLLICVLLGAGGVALTCEWAVDSLNANVAIGLASRDDPASSPAIDPALIPRGGWWTSTATHQAAWALALARAGDGEDRGEDVRSLLEAARHASRLGARSRFVLELPGSPEPGGPADLSHLGRTRDVVTLAWTGRRLRKDGKLDAAVRAYRSAMEIASRAGLADLDPPPFLEDRQVRRYALPRESLASLVARSMAEDGEWTAQQWAEALPPSAGASWAASRVLDLAKDRAGADRLADLAIAQSMEPTPQGFDPAEGLAAGAEALASRGRWTDAAEQYRRAIDLVDDDATRRMWWLNLAEVARRCGDDAGRGRAIEAARSPTTFDEITKRALRYQQDLPGLASSAPRP